MPNNDWWLAQCPPEEEPSPDEPISQSLTIVVEPPGGPEVDMVVTFAKVKAKGGQSTMGTVEVKADMDLDLPNPGDALAMYFDGINLFAAPFSHFVLASMDDENDGEDEFKIVYKYAADKPRVKLDLTEGLLRVDNNSVNLLRDRFNRGKSFEHTGKQRARRGRPPSG
jgi:hypothetical protein